MESKNTVSSLVELSFRVYYEKMLIPGNYLISKDNKYITYSMQQGLSYFYRILKKEPICVRHYLTKKIFHIYLDKGSIMLYRGFHPVKVPFLYEICYLYGQYTKNWKPSDFNEDDFFYNIGNLSIEENFVPEELSNEIKNGYLRVSHLDDISILLPIGSYIYAPKRIKGERWIRLQEEMEVILFCSVKNQLSPL